MKLKKLLTVLLAGALMIGNLSACASTASSESSTPSGSSESSSVSQEAIVVGVFDMPTLYLMQTFDEMGYYDENGANVEFQYFPVYSDAITAFNTNNVDMICYAAPEGVAPIVNGIDVKIIGAFDLSYGLDGIAAVDGIESVADLEGKKVATEIGTVDHLMLQRALENVGLTEADIELINMSAGDAAAAMQGGSLDAVSTWEPQLSTAAEAGSIIYSTVEDPDLIVDIFLIHADVLDAQYDNAKAILKTWYEGVEEYQDDSTKFAESAASKGDLTVEEFEELMSKIQLLSLEDNEVKFTDGEDDVKHLNVLMKDVGEFLFSGELIDEELTEEMIDNMIDSRIIEDLLKE